MVRNLLIVIGTVGALCMGSPSHAGSANVPQSSTTQNPPSAAGVFFDEADLKNDKGNQTLLSFPTPTGGQISFRTKTRNGIRGEIVFRFESSTDRVFQSRGREVRHADVHVHKSGQCSHLGTLQRCFLPFETTEFASVFSFLMLLGFCFGEN